MFCDQKFNPYQCTPIELSGIINHFNKSKKQINNKYCFSEQLEELSENKLSPIDKHKEKIT